MPSSLNLEKVLWFEEGQGIRTSGRIPLEAEFFKDHFPDFPVLPGVLALGLLKKTAERYFQEAGYNPSDFRLRLERVEQARFSQYLKPGDRWESHLKILSHDQNHFEWDAQLVHEGKRTAAAKIVTQMIKVSARAGV